MGGKARTAAEKHLDGGELFGYRCTPTTLESLQDYPSISEELRDALRRGDSGFLCLPVPRKIGIRDGSAIVLVGRDGQVRLPINYVR